MSSSAAPALSWGGQQLVSHVVLPVGKPCRHPRKVVASLLPTSYEVQGDTVLQTILSGAAQAFGGAVAQLTPALPHGPIGVHLRIFDHAIHADLSTDHAFTGSHAYGEFGEAEVPVLPVAAGPSVNVGEALAIPFPSPADAVRFENAYIERSCANEFIPPPTRQGTHAALGAPIVTPDNLAGMAVKLPAPVFGKPDAVIEDAVIGRYIIHIQIYSSFKTLGEAQNSAPFALAYALSSARITYQRCDRSRAHCASVGPNSTLTSS